MATTLTSTIPPPPLRYRLKQIVRSLIAFILSIIGALTTTIGIISSIMQADMWEPTMEASTYATDPDTGVEQLIEGDILFTEFETFLLAIGTLILGVVMIWVGRKLKRGNKELVLYLRKFGFSSSTKAITKAITIGLGKRWRIVTLDDSKTAPVGVSKGKKLLYILAEFLPFIIVPLILYMAYLGISDMAGETGANISKGFMENTMEESKDEGVVARLFVGLIGGIFAVLIGTLVALLMGVMLFMFVLVPTVLLGGITFFSVMGSSLAIMKAERAKSVSIQTDDDIEPQLKLIDKRSRGIIAPRLIIAHVSSLIWKKVIHAIDAAAEYIIIDVSNPTNHLMWEIENMQADSSNQIVYIGKEDHLEFVNKKSDLSEPEEGIKKMLDEKVILTYGELKRRSVRKFAVTLRRRMEWLQYESQR